MITLLKIDTERDRIVNSYLFIKHTKPSIKITHIAQKILQNCLTHLFPPFQHVLSERLRLSA